ncbi:MAG: GAF and ANTAR domain-containing protein [Candidatus Aureabacteria bacterium]|nr:GAF and ANTAR domain-containing protein [Candidatus Auribacterota bacterium]
MVTKKKNINEKKKIKQDLFIESILKITEAITSDLYIEDILKLIVTVTAEVLNSPICSLLLLEERKKELCVRATQSISEHYNKKPNIKLGEGIAGMVAKTGKAMTSNDVRKDNNYLNRDIAIKEHLCSLLCVPLIFKGNIIGVLNMYTSKPRDFSSDEINILKSVASQAAIVIENFRLVVESQVIKEELETRKAIERAKGILMKKQKLSEDDSYTLLRKFSMDHRKSMREVSEAIILSEDMREFATR